jgi:transcription elongation factor Elf1
MQTFDTEYTDYITCPHCGFEDGDSCEYALGDSESTKIDCGSCGKPFEATCCISVSYSTDKVENE